MYSFNGKVVWVTGSQSGIGKAIALQFIEHGADVVFHGLEQTDQDNQFIEKLSDKGYNVLFVKGDVTNKTEVEKMVECINSKFGRLDILVNNVGAFIKKARIEEIEEEAWDRTIEVNLKSVYLVTQASLPLLKSQQEARVINITSGVTRTGGTKEGAAYTAAKGGVKTLTLSLAKQLVEHNILVNGVSPGLIDTPFHTTEAPLNTYTNIINKIPLKRAGEPEEIAGAVLFLASKYASYIVGEIIEVSGGRRLS